MFTSRMTLCFARDNGKILLGKKKRGFGMGKWNGYGGKVKEGETFEEAARREWREETETDALGFSLRGILFLKGEDETHSDIAVRVYEVTDLASPPFESEEMEPKWFLECALPFDQMWPDDPHWMPLFLDGKYFTGTFSFEGKTLKTWEVKEVSPDELAAA